jgi:hypothetical protein
MGPALLFSAVHAIGAGNPHGMNFNFTLFALIGSLAGLFGLRKLGSRSVLLGMGGILAAANLVSITSLGFSRENAADGISSGTSSAVSPAAGSSRC